MQIETVSIGTISPDPANARKHGQRNIEAIKSSLRRFGQQKPIVVDAHGTVRAGNGTLEAARALGWTSIQIVRSDLQDLELTAFAIADNRTAELAEWDTEILAQLAQGDELGDVGFEEDELRALAGLSREKDPDQAESISQAFEVVIECRDEAQQRELFERLRGEGLSCRLFTL
jgi:ParB-like chromosome segregation protein Spo0J